MTGARSRKRGNPEARLSIVLYQYLSAVLPKEAADTLAHIPNEGRRGLQTQRLLKAMGIRAGVEDYQFAYQGRLYALEAKCEGNYQTAAQKARQAAVEAAGGRYAIVRSTEDVAEVLAEWGIPTRDVSWREAEKAYV